MRKMNRFKCHNCGKDFEVHQQVKRKFCSIECYTLGRSGPKAPDGAGSVGAHGYRYIRVDGKKHFEHRYVMSLHIGRPLLRSEVVHHKDGNKLNNSISNLELLQSQADHMAEHVKRFASDTHKECSKCETVKPRTDFNMRGKSGHNSDPNTAYCRSCQAEVFQERKKKSQAPCSVCGRTDIPSAYGGRCGTCSSKHYRTLANKQT